MSDLSEFLRWQQTKKIDARSMDKEERSEAYEELLNMLQSDLDMFMYYTQKAYDDVLYSVDEIKYGITSTNSIIGKLEKFKREAAKLIDNK